MSRQHPWRADNPDAVIVARPSKWGNPWAIGDMTAHARRYDTNRVATLVVDRGAAVAMFKCWANKTPDFIAAVLAELAGKDLACWCPIDQPCHADVLLEIANRDGA